MSAINNGGPAFPVQDAASWQSHGMSLRDWFASQVDISAYNPRDSLEVKLGRTPSTSEVSTFIAAIRYFEADKMLAERERGGAV